MCVSVCVRGERDNQRQRKRRGRGEENSNSKTLFYKACNSGSVKNLPNN